MHSESNKLVILFSVSLFFWISSFYDLQEMNIESQRTVVEVEHIASDAAARHMPFPSCRFLSILVESSPLLSHVRKTVSRLGCLA